MSETLRKSAHEHAEALADSLSSLVITGPADTFELDTEKAYEMIMRYYGELALDLMDDISRVLLENPSEVKSWVLACGAEAGRLTGRGK